MRDYTISVTFGDGFVREVDLADELSGEVFEPLRDKAFFKKVRFDSDARTASWPNGVDLAPEFLRWGAHLPKGCPCGYDDPE